MNKSAVASSDAEWTWETYAPAGVAVTPLVNHVTAMRIVGAPNVRHLLLWLMLVSNSAFPACTQQESRSERTTENRINARGFEFYTRSVLGAAGAKATIERCAMFGQTRAGYCILRAPGAELDKLRQHFKLVSKDYDELTRDSCLNLTTFGTAPKPHAAAAGWKPLRDTKRYEPGAAALPKNDQNVRFRALYLRTSSGVACVEYHYPYG